MKIALRLRPLFERLQQQAGITSDLSVRLAMVMMEACDPSC
jgi:hypothetical protein